MPKFPRSAGAWIAAVLITAVAVAVIFRVPQVKKIVVGD